MPGVFDVVFNTFSYVYLLVILFFSSRPPVTAGTVYLSVLVIGSIVSFNVVYYLWFARKVYVGPVAGGWFGSKTVRALYHSRISSSRIGFGFLGLVYRVMYVAAAALCLRPGQRLEYKVPMHLAAPLPATCNTYFTAGY